MAATQLQRAGEVARLFAKIGFTGFGGPAVTIAMMEDEVVARRQWLTREHFVDLVGATNLIPGPNAAEIAIHIGYLRAGWLGFALAGICFILPAALITTALAWAYVRFGALPAVGPLLLGIKPAVLAVIAVAMWRMGRTAAKSWHLVAVGLAVTMASLVGMNEILALFAGGLLGMAWLSVVRRRQSQSGRPLGAALMLPLAGIPRRVAAGAGIAGLMGASAASVNLLNLGLFFLKIGSVLYGSGYVLVAFLQGGLVHDYGWLTQRQLLDAIAAGQFTPGPLLSTAAFVGYILLGPGGAAVSTLAVFAPSFLFVAILSPLVPRFRRSAWSSAFLDAVNVSSLGLMLAVTARLASTALQGWAAWAIALVAAAASIRWKLNPTWLVVGGAVAGYILGPWLS